MACWFSDERMDMLKISKKDLTKEVLDIFETLDDVKDHKTMIEFASKFKNLKKVSRDDLLLITAFDARLISGDIDSYIKELSEFKYSSITPRAALPSVYLNTYGESEIEEKGVYIDSESIESMEKKINDDLLAEKEKNEETSKETPEKEDKKDK